MDLPVILLVLLAACMHAAWNALIKVGEDRLVGMAMMMTVMGLWAPLLLLLGPPPAVESWPYIVASALLNNAYFLFLIEAYRVGDLSHAYPLSRGSAPLIVAVGAAVFAGELLTWTEMVGIALVSGGIISLMVGAGRPKDGGWRTIVYPLLTGLMIAVYTVVDGIGVRLSGNPAGYIGWLFILAPLPLLTIALAVRRGQFIGAVRARWRPAALGGSLSMGAYGLAIWALSLGAMAHVSALRETSVIIAALIGTLFLGEPFGRRRVIAAAVVAAGVVVMNLGVAG